MVDLILKRHVGNMGDKNQADQFASQYPKAFCEAKYNGYGKLMCFAIYVRGSEQDRIEVAKALYALKHSNAK